MITSLQSYVHTNSCQTHQTERQSRNQTCWHRFSINVNTTTVFITDVMKGKFPQFLSRSHREDDMSVPVLSRRKDGPQQSTGRRRIKADSHVACHAHAVPLPCCATKGLNVSFPFHLHSAAVSDSHLPCSDLAVLLKVTAQQGLQEMACGLPVRVRLLPATTRSSTKIVIRNIPILLTTIHTNDCKEWQEHTTKKTSC